MSDYSGWADAPALHRFAFLMQLTEGDTTPVDVAEQFMVNVDQLYHEVIVIEGNGTYVLPDFEYDTILLVADDPIDISSSGIYGLEATEFLSVEHENTIDTSTQNVTLTAGDNDTVVSILMVRSK